LRPCRTERKRVIRGHASRGNQRWDATQRGQSAARGRTSADRKTCLATPQREPTPDTMSGANLNIQADRGSMFAFRDAQVPERPRLLSGVVRLPALAKWEPVGKRWSRTCVEAAPRPFRCGRVGREREAAAQLNSIAGQLLAWAQSAGANRVELRFVE